jgi:D-serine deaminase-like pyridoxal phosphate-dependent protein
MSLIASNYENLKDLVKNKKAPLVFCDLKTFKQNLDKAGKLLKSKNKLMRVCTKSVRVPELIKIVEQQEFVNGIFAFNSAEVLYYAKDYKFKDILLGYPITSDIDAEELCQAAKVEGVNVSVMVDDVKQIQLLEGHAKNHNVHLDLLIEIDVSYRFLSQTVGVLRSPLKQVDEILQLAQIIENADSLSMRGIMGYEAQNASLGDNKLLYRFVKRKSRKYVNTMRNDIVNNLTNAGYSLEVVNGGGSGCFQENLEEPSITEIGIGSLLFKPHIFDTINSLDEFKPSLFFILQIVRKPRENIATAFSGGYVSSGAGRNPPKPVVPEGLKTLKFEGFGEVQTPFKYNPANISLTIGDPIFCRFAKAGEPLEHFNEILIYNEGEIIDTYKTYRGLGKRFS